MTRQSLFLEKNKYSYFNYKNRHLAVFFICIVFFIGNCELNFIFQSIYISISVF